MTTLNLPQISRPAIKLKVGDKIIATLNASLISSPEKIIKSLTSSGGVTITVLGSSRSGKTTFLINTLMPIFSDYVTLMFAPSFSSSIYDPVRTVPVVQGYDESIVTAAAYLNKIRDDKLPILFILDDVVTAKKSSTLSEMYLTLRNLNISTITLTQYYTMVKPEIRQNVNFSFYFRINSQEGRKNVVDTLLNDLFITGGTADNYDLLTQKYIIMSDNINGSYYLISK